MMSLPIKCININSRFSAPTAKSDTTTSSKVISTILRDGMKLS